MIHSLLDIFGGEVQVSVADPLNFKPVPEIVVSTAAKLHLQTINGLFLKTAARHVRVLVETNTIPEANLTVGEREVKEKDGGCRFLSDVFEKAVTVLYVKNAVRLNL